MYPYMYFIHFTTSRRETYPLSPNPAQTNVGLELRELVLYITGDTLAVPFLTGDVIGKRPTPCSKG